MKGITDPNWPKKKAPSGVLILAHLKRSMKRRDYRAGQRAKMRPAIPALFDYDIKITGEDIRDANGRNGVGSAKRRSF